MKKKKKKGHFLQNGNTEQQSTNLGHLIDHTKQTFLGQLPLPLPSSHHIIQYKRIGINMMITNFTNQVFIQSLPPHNLTHKNLIKTKYYQNPKNENKINLKEK